MFGIPAHGLERKISLVREGGIKVLQRHVVVVVQYVATQQLRPRLSPETSKGIGSKIDRNARR